MFFIISVHLLLERAVFGEKSCYLNHLANEILGKETRVDTLWGKAVTKEHQENTKNLHRIFSVFYLWVQQLYCSPMSLLAEGKTQLGP